LWLILSIQKHSIFKFFPDFTMEYIQKNGFSMPLLFKDKIGLNMKVPKSDFSVGDVRQCVGNFTIDIIVVICF